MRDLLRQAIIEIEKLSASEQDTVAMRILSELGDQAWESKFAGTSEQQWDSMAASVRQEITDCETLPLEDIFRHNP